MVEGVSNVAIHQTESLPTLQLNNIVNVVEATFERRQNSKKKIKQFVKQETTFPFCHNQGVEKNVEKLIVEKIFILFRKNERIN